MTLPARGSEARTIAMSWVLTGAPSPARLNLLLSDQRRGLRAVEL
jgi:hypothetical protein